MSGYQRQKMSNDSLGKYTLGQKFSFYRLEMDMFEVAPRPVQLCPKCGEVVVTAEDKLWHNIIHRGEK